MQNNYIGVYEDTRPEWRRSVEQDLYHYANEYNIPVVVLYDFTRFLEYYLPENFDYVPGKNTEVDFIDGQLVFQYSDPYEADLLSLTITQDYGVEVKITDCMENKTLVHFTISVRNYYNETLKAIVKKLLKCPATDVSTYPPPMK